MLLYLLGRWPSCFCGDLPPGGARVHSRVLVLLESRWEAFWERRDKDFIKRNPSKIIRLSWCFLVMTAEEVLSLTCHWKLCFWHFSGSWKEGFDYTGGIGLQRAPLGFKWRHTDHDLPFLCSPCQPPLSTLLPYPGVLPGVVILNFIFHW